MGKAKEGGLVDVPKTDLQKLVIRLRSEAMRWERQAEDSRVGNYADGLGEACDQLELLFLKPVRVVTPRLPK